MKRKIMVLAAAIFLLAFVPAAAGAAGGPGGGGVPAADRGGQGAQVGDQTQNQGAAKSLKAGNEIGEDAQKAGEAGTGLLDRVRQRLQTMQQDKTMQQDRTRQDWQTLKEELSQLKEEYKGQTESQSRQEIRNMYRQAFQYAKQLAAKEELKPLLEEMISMDPKDPENYEELGAVLIEEEPADPVVFCDGRRLRPDAPPVIRENRTLIPVRAITEALGATVEWNEAEQTVNINRGETSIQLQVRNRVAQVNGAPVELESPAEINGSRVFVPLRFISQALKSEVNYYPEGRIVTVNQ